MSHDVADQVVDVVHRIAIVVEVRARFARASSQGDVEILGGLEYGAIGRVAVAVVGRFVESEREKRPALRVLRVDEGEHVAVQVGVFRIRAPSGELLLHRDAAEDGVLDLVPSEVGVGEDPEPVVVRLQHVDEQRVVDLLAAGLDRRPIGGMDAVEQAKHAARRRVARAEVVQEQRRPAGQSIDVRRSERVHGVVAPALEQQQHDVWRPLAGRNDARHRA